ncbi:MAG: hypothetical protein LBT09_16080, partial [Planctomycetaceae bacterium]|nr:hypothetical protein [Planctomycetaceae bacterium]
MRTKNYILILSICCLLTCQLFGQEILQKESADLSDDEFIERYNKLLPERLETPFRGTSSMPPIWDRNNCIQFYCYGYKDKGKWLYTAQIQRIPHDAVNISPFRDFMRQLFDSYYSTIVEYTPRYSIVPIFGRFYYIDSLENLDELEKSKIDHGPGIAYRLESNEYPENISLSKKSIVFFRSTPRTKSFKDDPGSTSGRLYKQDIYVRDINLLPDSKTEYHVNIILTRPGKGIRIPADLREGWYKVGDILEFAKAGHRITNIVAPRVIEKEIRGHKCYLIGYIELAPEPILQLQQPAFEEIEEVFPPQPEPALTEEEKAEMRTWHVTRIENNKKKVYKITAAFNELGDSKLGTEWVGLRYSNMNYTSIPLHAFSESDQKLIRDIVSQRQKFSAEMGIDFSFVPHETYKQEVDGESVTITQVIGEDIRLTLKAKNISNDTISIYKKRLSNSECYNVYVSSQRGKSIKSMFIKYQPVSLDSTDWITLKPKEEYLYSIPQSKFARWRLPQNGESANFSMIGGNGFVYRYDKLDIPLELRKKIVANGT